MHPYSVTPTRLGHILANLILGHFQVKMMPGDVMVEAEDHIWQPLIAFHIHIKHIQCIVAPFNNVCGHMSASLLCYTNEARSDFSNSGSLLSIHDAMMSWLRL